MILALDIGNSQIFCGVFEREQLKVQVRYASKAQISSDEFGVFLRGALRENGVDPESIKTIGISSVVPELNYALRACSQKYFNVEPMILQPGVKTGLKVDYKDPKEVGSDRIADAIGAVKMFPNRDLILVDFGTATTVCDRHVRHDCALTGIPIAEEDHRRHNPCSWADSWATTAILSF